MNYGFGNRAAKYSKMLFQERGDVESAAAVRTRALSLAEELDDPRLIPLARYPTEFWIQGLEPNIGTARRAKVVETAQSIGDLLLEQKMLINPLWWA